MFLTERNRFEKSSMANSNVILDLPDELLETPWMISPTSKEQQFASEIVNNKQTPVGARLNQDNSQQAMPEALFDEFSCSSETGYNNFEHPNPRDSEQSYSALSYENECLFSNLKNDQILDWRDNQIQQQTYQEYPFPKQTYSISPSCKHFSNLELTSHYTPPMLNSMNCAATGFERDNNSISSLMRRHSYNCSQSQKELACNRDRTNSAGIYETSGCADLYSAGQSAAPDMFQSAEAANTSYLHSN